MPREYPRTVRVAEQLRQELSQLIREEVSDPRLGPVTVTSVQVARDFSHAKVFVSFLGQSAGIDEKLAILQHAARALQGLLGRRLRLRVIPSLHFQYDEVLDYGQRMDALITKARAADDLRSDPSADAAEE
ncbi:30S ribosome-binding factor RbfA [Candidatus Macondimonas diazotrophica]|jgi:ribosome-binding factor A|uniref:Ribosome-binding factor A n=1 Tax=Candidatus Macondimonas diazotrophica TaxID=2305248 RepID=A0A4Z0F950_9GAMM|nr:30S ribosome-binding factor RbfA [Candidatus Macondimonas diazotrophica]NCU01264.1 30S ribosome-binding factor RbfA [Candidatus Macondimonas diazotrophica]TFZ82911.1 30S ribosome-binding factor RbfA [Candidatus Macondimonas diazotrophica]HBG50844.1 30S ribosome-binding factor RbfA [Gammaproteobacteria bacterium]